MDKYEYKVRAEEIKTLIARGEYVQAVEIADMIDWRRVKSVMMLCTISDLYKINRRFEDARDLLLLAYDRHPGGRTIVYSLCELSIKMEEFVQAVEYYKEFVQIAPKDSGRYILQYKLYEAQDVGLEERIAVLEELKKRDYREKWAYELAYLYHRVGLSMRCVEECDELILWFGEGKYVVKAMELKMLHQPLTSSQQKKYDNRFLENPDLGQETAASEDSRNGYEDTAYRNGGYEGEAGYSAEGYGEAAYDTGSGYAGASDYGGDPGYGENSDYYPEQGYNEDSGYGEADYGGNSAYGGEADYGGNPAYGGEADYGGNSAYGGEADYGGNPAYGGETDYGGNPAYGGEADYSGNPAYGEAASYEENADYSGKAAYDASTGYGEDSFYEENSGYEEERSYGEESGYEDNRGIGDNAEYDVNPGGYDGRVPSGEPEELDIQVKTMSVGQYDTINLQKELAEGLKEVLGASGNESDFIRPDSPFPEELEESGLEPEEIQESEVFFGETGELEDLEGGPLAGTVKEAGQTGHTAQDTAGMVMDELRREIQENSAGRHEHVQEETPGVQALEGDMQAKEPDDNILRPESSEPPRELADVLAMESDGQISLVVPEQDIIEKQITGQLSIEDILSEWERMKKNNEEKRKEAVRQKVLEHTGSMFTEFEESVRDGLLEKLEGGRDNSAPQENILNFRRPETGDEQEKQDAEGQAQEIQRPWNRSVPDGTDYGMAGSAQEPGARDGDIEDWNRDSEEAGPAGEEADGSGLSYENSEDLELSAEEEEESGLSYEDFEDLGLSAEEEEESGLSYEDPEDLGPSAGEAEECGLSYEDFEDLGLSAEEEEESGLSYEDSEDLGPSAGEAEECGLSYEDFEDLGPSAGEAEGAGLACEDSEDSGLSAEELKGLGLRYEDSEEPGLSAEASEGLRKAYREPEGFGRTYGESEDSGRTYKEPEAAGLKYEDSEDLGLSAEELKGLGLRHEDSEESGLSDEESDESGSKDAERKAPGANNSVQKGSKEKVSVTQESGKDGTSEGKTGHCVQSKSPAQQDKARIRGLTKEERELYGPYIQNKSSREHLVTAIDNISLAACTGNVIVTGEEGMDTMTLAKNMIREVQMNDSNFSGKIAKISGAALNAKDPVTILNQLKNGALMIQKASGMDEKTAKALYKGLQQESLGIIVVLEDSKKAVNRFLEKYPELAGCFNARMDVEALSNDTLAAFGRKYARELEFSIDELGMLALHTRIEDLQTSDHVVTVMDVKEIMDEAIRKASKKSFSHFFDILLAKRYDEEDMIILREKDFV